MHMFDIPGLQSPVAQHVHFFFPSTNELAHNLN